MSQEGGESKYQSQVSEYLRCESAVSDKNQFWTVIKFMTTTTYYTKCFLHYMLNIHVRSVIKVYSFEIDLLKFCDKAEIVKWHW